MSSRTSRSPGLLRHLEQLPGVGQGGVGVGESGQHPRQLALALGVVEDRETRARHRAVRGLLDDDGPDTEPPEAFPTATSRSASAATCERWVTTSTWALRASCPSRRPTSTAAA